MLDLTKNGFETLRRDEEFVLYRGRHIDTASQILLLSPAAVNPSPIILRRIENEYSLREELDPTWSARPMAVARHLDRTVLVLEDPGGLPLDQVVGQPLELGFSLRVAIGLNNASRHLHERGIVHKDIKPANVLIDSATGQVWLMGFGIASRLPHEPKTSEPPEFLEGTLAYMAPEQTGRMNRAVDYRSDLYSIGVTLYQMLTGSLPFKASDPMEWVYCHIARKPEPPSERLGNVPAGLSAIVMKLLAKTPEERYQTAAGVEHDLRRCLETVGKSPRSGITTKRRTPILDRAKTAPAGTVGSLSAVASRSDDYTSSRSASQARRAPRKGGRRRWKEDKDSLPEALPLSIGSSVTERTRENEAAGQISEFPLGQHDAPGQLLIPDKLYGRAAEVDILLAAFDRVVANGRTELALVSGYSGIGKSAVVNELKKAIVPARALFASGKFDQQRRNVPYATLAQALQGLIQPLLAKSEAELAPWRSTFLEVLGPNGRLIVDLVPELAHIIGQPPPAPELSSHDVQRRFRLVFRRFISVFARPEHPLVLFLDDLQWLEAATLDLIEDLLTQADMRHLLLVGAYRDNEVTATHPLMRKLATLCQAGAPLQELNLTPLAEADVLQLVAEVIRCAPAEAASLAQLVHEKTAGNPFFLIHFLHEMAAEGLLVFDHAQARWDWNLDRIHAKGYTDNVVDLMAGKLSRLPVGVQNALQVLAALGNGADVATLSLVQGLPEERVHTDFLEALRLALIERQHGSYKFAHDRIQEAAYALIPEDRKAAEHLRIGRLLAMHTPPEKREEVIFEIVNQLNRATALITSRDERDELAQLNLIAGKRAKASTAYSSALKYLLAGATLLADDRWERRHELTFALEMYQAECEFLTGQSVAAVERLSTLSSRASNSIERATVAGLRVDLYTALGQSELAVVVCLDYLRGLGIDWSLRPTEAEARYEYERIWSQLGDRAVEGLIELPLMSDPASLATMDVLTKVLPPAAFTDLNLVDLIICRMVNLSLEQGNSDSSCFAYACLGMAAGPHFNDYKAGFRFGRLGYELVERRGLRRFQARTYMTVGAHLVVWTRHVRIGQELMRRAFKIANKSGDLIFGAYSCLNLNTNLLAAGDPLGDVQREAERGLQFAQMARFGFVSDIIVVQLGLIRTLRGLTPKFGSFDDGQFNELRFEHHLFSNPALKLPECWYWIRKLQARFMAGDYRDALDASSKAQRLLWISRSMFETAEYHFYGALSQAAFCETGRADRRRRSPSVASAKAEHIEALLAHHRQLEIWAENGPENFENRVALVSAEIARIEGRELDAERLYEKAIHSAHANGFVHNEALANELAARFYAARGFETVSNAYLRNAWSCYHRWGATGKLRQLEELYPNLKDASVPALGSTVGARVESLDLATVIKVSQAVSGEIVLSKLINELMRIALEQAGAERGLLILARGKERRIEAEALLCQGSEGQGNGERSQVTVQFRQSLVTPADLPESLLRYVIRTQESVTLRDASAENLFSQDEYIRQKHPRSVFCLPLIKQGRLVGVLYLENNLAPGVFTSKQLAILELIASEAAISLEQARLYGQLTQENSERRKVEKALRASEERWRKLFENSSAGIALITLDGRLFAANYAFQKMLGYTEQELHRLTSLDLTIEEDRPADEALRAEAVAGRWKDYRVERRFRRKDGSAVWTDVSAVYVPVAESESGFFSAVIVDITERKQAEEMQIAIAHERETLMRQRAADLAKANEALRSCLDALASVPELDAFIGQVMATITRQLGAVSSNLRVLDPGQKKMRIELLFQDGSVMSPADAGYPERFQSLALEGIGFSFLEAPYTVLNLSAPQALEMPADLRTYLQGLGVRTLLIIPLVSQGCINGLLNFRFAEERVFEAEELEIARALATQAGLAIHLTELATSARQSAVLEERTRLAGEIHDSLAQSFTGITMQLEMAKELKTDNDDEVFNYVERANDLARFGLAEARRSVMSLHSLTAKDSGLIESLQTLAQRSNIAGRLRCTFRSNLQDDESVPIEVRQDLLRIAQEAISNALRHAKSTAISVTLRSDPPNLVLKVKDNGVGITTKAETKEGFGFVNMRARVEKLKGTLDIRTVPGRGTNIIVRVPVNG